MSIKSNLIEIANEIDKDYLSKLLSLCTDKQKDRFSKMYPNGPIPKQITRAIQQIENTLSDLNIYNEENIELKKYYNEITNNLCEVISNQESSINKLEHDLHNANISILLLKTPINLNNKDISYRLSKLEALEAAGVDNWEWYEEAMNSINAQS